MSNLERVHIRCDGNPWTLTITNADTGESITCVERVEYVNEIKGHYVKLWISASDVDLDVTAPVEIIKETESLPVVHVELDIKKLADKVEQELSRRMRMSGRRGEEIA